MQPLCFHVPFQRNDPQIHLYFILIYISVAYKLISHQQTKSYNNSWSLENCLW